MDCCSSNKGHGETSHEGTHTEENKKSPWIAWIALGLIALLLLGVFLF